LLLYTVANNSASGFADVYWLCYYDAIALPQITRDQARNENVENRDMTLTLYSKFHVKNKNFRQVLKKKKAFEMLIYLSSLNTILI